MKIREAVVGDIQQMQTVKKAVLEYISLDLSPVRDGEDEEYISMARKSWVCEVDDEIVGFSSADLKDRNLCALYLKPGYDNLGIGRQLQHEMVNFYFTQKEKGGLCS